MFLLEKRETEGDEDERERERGEAKASRTAAMAHGSERRFKTISGMVLRYLGGVGARWLCGPFGNVFVLVLVVIPRFCYP